MLEKNDLLNIYGGAIDFAVVGVVVAAVIFVIGVIDGIVRPLSCRK